MLGSSWGGITTLGIYYANNSYMLWLVQHVRIIVGTYYPHIGAKLTRHKHIGDILLFYGQSSFVHSKADQIPTGEEAFLWVSHLHLKHGATYMHSNTQKGGRSKKGDLQHLLDEIL